MLQSLVQECEACGVMSFEFLCEALFFFVLRAVYITRVYGNVSTVGDVVTRCFPPPVPSLSDAYRKKCLNCVFEQRVFCIERRYASYACIKYITKIKLRTDVLCSFSVEI